MTTRFTFTRHAVAAALLSWAAAMSAAAAPVSFTVSGSVTDVKNGAATTLPTAPSTTTALPGFDPSLGVLTGAQLLLQSTRSQTTNVTVTAGGTNGNNGQRTTTGTGTSSASLSGAGVTPTNLGNITLSDTCTGRRHNACSDGVATSSTTTNASLGIANLDALVGAATVAVTASLPLVRADQGNGQFNGEESTAYTVTWSGTLELAYTYLLHAAASFDATGLSTLDLAFGNVALGSVAALDFGVFNLFAADRVGLDLDSVSGTGDTARLTTNLSLFSALAAGNGNMFQAMLDTTTVGDFEASYILYLSDADVGAASSRHTYQLTLNLRGSVFDPNSTVDDPPPPQQPRNDVPEPATLALLAAGLVGLGASRRRAL